MRRPTHLHSEAGLLLPLTLTSPYRLTQCHDTLSILSNDVFYQTSIGVSEPHSLLPFFQKKTPPRRV